MINVGSSASLAGDSASPIVLMTVACKVEPSVKLWKFGVKDLGARACRADQRFESFHMPGVNGSSGCSGCRGVRRDGFEGGQCQLRRLRRQTSFFSWMRKSSYYVPPHPCKQFHRMRFIVFDVVMAQKGCSESIHRGDKGLRFFACMQGFFLVIVKVRLRCLHAYITREMDSVR